MTDEEFSKAKEELFGPEMKDKSIFEIADEMAHRDSMPMLVAFVLFLLFITLMAWLNGTL